MNYKDIDWFWERIFNIDKGNLHIRLRHFKKPINIFTAHHSLKTFCLIVPNQVQFLSARNKHFKNSYASLSPRFVEKQKDEVKD